MPRFFFHIRDGTYLPDTEGTELPNIEAARIQAVRASGEANRDLGVKFWDYKGEWEMNVTDEGGNKVVTLKFSAGR